MRSPRSFLITGFMLSLALTGCGSTQDDPADTAFEALTAVVKLDGKAFCDLRLEASGPDASDEDKEKCLEEVAEQREEMDKLSKEEKDERRKFNDEILDSIDRDSFTAKTDGDKSTVTFKITLPDGESEEDTIDLEKHDGKWYYTD